MEGYVHVKPLGPVPVKGLAAPVEIYEMVGAGPLRSRLHAAAARPQPSMTTINEEGLLMPTLNEVDPVAHLLWEQ